MNREMRRLQAKEEERAKRKRGDAPRPKQKKKDDGLNFIQRIQKYIREVRQELKKVAWPSREELVTYSVVVFGMTTVLTLLVFGADWVFQGLVVNVLNAIT